MGTAWVSTSTLHTLRLEEFLRIAQQMQARDTRSTITGAWNWVVINNHHRSRIHHRHSRWVDITLSVEIFSLSILERGATWMTSALGLIGISMDRLDPTNFSITAAGKTGKLVLVVAKTQG